MLSHCIPNAIQLGVGIYAIYFNDWNDMSYLKDSKMLETVPCRSTCEDTAHTKVTKLV